MNGFGFDFNPQKQVWVFLYTFSITILCLSIVKMAYSSININMKANVRLCFDEHDLKSKLVELENRDAAQNDVSWNFYSAPHIRYSHTHTRHEKKEPSVRYECIGRIWYVCTHLVSNIFQGEILESTFDNNNKSDYLRTFTNIHRLRYDTWSTWTVEKKGFTLHTHSTQCAFFFSSSIVWQREAIIFVQPLTVYQFQMKNLRTKHKHRKKFQFQWAMTQSASTTQTMKLKQVSIFCVIVLYQNITMSHSNRTIKDSNQFSLLFFCCLQSCVWKWRKKKLWTKQCVYCSLFRMESSISYI